MSLSAGGPDRSVERPTLLYIISQAVIPVPYQVRGRLIESGMTSKVKGLLTRYTSMVQGRQALPDNMIT
jgi:hypothetical protein